MMKNYCCNYGWNANFWLSGYKIAKKMKKKEKKRKKANARDILRCEFWKNVSA